MSYYHLGVITSVYPSHLAIACKEPQVPMLISCLELEVACRVTLRPRLLWFQRFLEPEAIGAIRPSLVFMGSIDVVFGGFSRQICINWRLPPSAIPRSSEAFHHYIDSCMPLVVLIVACF